MPTGKHLSDFERGQIVAPFNKKKPKRETARIIKRSDKVVRNFLKIQAAPYPKKHCGRPSKLSERTMRRLVKRASNSTNSCRDLNTDLQLDVHRSTVLRGLMTTPHLDTERLCAVSALKTEDKTKRMEFARENLARDWNKVGMGRLNIVILCFNHCKLVLCHAGDIQQREKN